MTNTERRRSSDVPPASRRVRSTISFRRQSDDLPATITRFGRWWDALAKKHRVDPRSEESQEFGYHVVELVKNGLAASESVRVTASIESVFFRTVVEDDGDGFPDLQGTVTSGGGDGHGLARAIAFADFITIETGQSKFVKKDLSKTIETTPSARKGTRIEIVKLRGIPT